MDATQDQAGQNDRAIYGRVWGNANDHFIEYRINILAGILI
jgi:hypothetical protein